jgi:phenylpropionate dioxygenase-like ring-hydroxylating dioxygenase large terminal subunit
MFLRNCWYVAGWSHQVQPGEIVARRILCDPIILYRTATGKVVAMEDRCCHRFAPLSLGRLEGDDIRCMYHGIKYSATGECVEIPAQDRIPPGVRVRTYPVVEKDRWVWVWTGDATRADLSLIPSALNHEDPDYLISTGELAYEANYQLIHDNLLDLTHLSFVHEKTLGRGSMEWGTARPIVTPIEQGVRVSRWLRNRPTTPYVRAPQQLWDSWASYDFVVPGLFLLRTSFYPAGTSDRFPEGPVDLPEPGYVVVTSQAITPISDKETIYYYSGGQPKRQADQDLTESQVKSFGVAFLEDKAMIEAQQKVLNSTVDRSMMTLTFDRSIAIFRRLMATLMDQEARGEAPGGKAGSGAIAAE